MIETIAGDIMERPDTFGLALNEIALDSDVEADIATAVQAVVEAEIKPDPKTDVSTPRDNYNLSVALGIIRRMETSEARSNVFAEIKNKNPVYRMVDALYSAAGSHVMQPLVLFAYMLKCVLSIGTFDYDDQEAVAISNFHNETNAIARLVSLLPGARIMQLS